MRITRMGILLVVMAAGVTFVACAEPPIVAPTKSPSVSVVTPQVEASCTITPSLVGEVFVIEGGTRRPATKLWVGYHAKGVSYWGDAPWPSFIADAQGRYAFCGVPVGSALVAAGGCNDALDLVSVEIVPGENRQDIDVSWLLS